MKSILAFEFGVVIVTVMIMSIFPIARDNDHLSRLAALWFMVAVLHSLIIPFKGVDFIIRDAPSESLCKYYWFLAIFIAAFTAGFIENAFSDLASKIVMLWVR